MKLRDVLPILKASDIVLEDFETLEVIFDAHDTDGRYRTVESACRIYFDCEVVEVCAGISYTPDDEYNLYHGCIIVTIKR